MSSQYDIDSLLDEVVTLPSRPDSLTRITGILDDPNGALTDVAKAISGDPSIALKALRLVNSAYYGLGQQVTTVEHAVVLLGAKVIKNLVITATVLDQFQSDTLRFFPHSVACGVMMRTLVEQGVLKHNDVDGDEAFVFGLLHDIGKVIFEAYLPEAFVQVHALVGEKHLPWYQAERQVIGVDHAELGARLAYHWRLSPLLVGAIAGHHAPNLCEDANVRHLAACLCVADYVATMAGLPCHSNPNMAVALDAWEYAGITSTALPGLLDAYFTAYPTVQELVGLAA